MNKTINKIRAIYSKDGWQNYGIEPVTQLQHGLQAASMALEETDDSQLVTAALLHDIGHMMSEEDLPKYTENNLDDDHEKKAYHWLLENFGPRVADPVLLHVEAKRYLCTQDDSYIANLSPTSLKSFHDQGGKMTDKEKAEFESQTFFEEAVLLRKWDDRAKNPDMETLEFEKFIPHLKHSLSMFKGS